MRLPERPSATPRVISASPRMETPMSPPRSSMSLAVGREHSGLGDHGALVGAGGHVFDGGDAARRGGDRDEVLNGADRPLPGLGRGGVVGVHVQARGEEPGPDGVLEDLGGVVAG
ncbi:hypothetical protein G5V59_02550 [Nocardioides sp. W3-2-3]|uniref:hypothetical protein n=1 Tax=Nocardioides convexus TaxID=2712224 RepID=UPI0024185E1D|nr:hypothetical protein [Nocardioides convexus]NGZ99633.1 hypothetical protein [Nocardioides convexus]